MATKGIDVDTVLAREIGQFGRYQARFMVFVFVVCVVSGLVTGEYLFTAARIPTRCLIPECESPGGDFSTPWLTNAIPPSGGSFDNCFRFNTTLSQDDDDIDDGICPASLFDNQTRISCEAYVYENTNTIVYEFDLACEEWLRSLVGSFQTFGILLSLPLTGLVSDRWGRRLALSLTAFNFFWIGLIRTWASSYLSYVTLQFLESLLGGGNFSCIYLLLMEVVGPKYRVAAGAAANCSFTVGQMLVGLMAWALPYWRTLTLAIYAPQVLVISYYWIAPESIRWYQSKGHFDKAEILLKKMAEVNRRELSEKTLEELKQNTILKMENDKLKVTIEKDSLIKRVYRCKPVLFRVCVSPVWWVTTTFVYYGLSINAVNMVQGNVYLNWVAVVAVEIPGFVLGVFFMNIVGRKPVLITGFWVCALCQLGYIFIPQDVYWLSLLVYLVGKVSISAVGGTMYVYTAELYPTECRHTLFAASSMVGRVGAILAPLTPALASAVYEPLPFILFGSLSVVAGALVTLTPETRGAPLPDTLEQAAQLGNKPELRTRL